MMGAVVALLALALLPLAGCQGTGDAQVDANGDAAVESELVVYSSRNEKFVDPLLARFEADTGIRVKALHAGDGAVNKLQEERANVQADVFVSNDVGALEFLRSEGLLRRFEAPGLETIAPEYRAEDGSWFALSARTRVLMYNKSLTSEDELPKRIEDLADLRYKGRFAITRGGNASMIGHVSALRYEWGDDRTAAWVAAVKENAGGITDGHGDIRKAVGAGEFEFGLVNNYYYHQQLLEPTDNDVGVVYLDQGDGEMGAVVNAAGVALVEGGPNPGAARRFLEWLLQPGNQLAFSYESLEVPINPDIEPPKGAARITDYDVHGMPLRELGRYWTDTRDLIERSGLDLELR